MFERVKKAVEDVRQELSQAHRDPLVLLSAASLSLSACSDTPTFNPHEIMPLDRPVPVGEVKPFVATDGFELNGHLAAGDSLYVVVPDSGGSPDLLESLRVNAELFEGAFVPPADGVVNVDFIGISNNGLERESSTLRESALKLPDKIGGETVYIDNPVTAASLPVFVTSFSQNIEERFPLVVVKLPEDISSVPSLTVKHSREDWGEFSPQLVDPSRIYEGVVVPTVEIDGHQLIADGNGGVYGIYWVGLPNNPQAYDLSISSPEPVACRVAVFQHTDSGVLDN